MKKVITFLKNAKRKVVTTAVAIGTAIATSTVAMAAADLTGDPATYTPTSMLSTEASNIVTNFGSNVVVTVVAIIGLVITVGLTIWGIKFGIFTGVNMIKKYAKSKA